MFDIRGKYASATIHTDLIEESAVAQIVELCNQPMFEHSSIHIMPDVHSGKGCVIGFTATIKDKIIPNLVGVDIGCGVRTSYFKTKNSIDFKALDQFIRQNIPHGCSVNQKQLPEMDTKIEHYIKTVASIVDNDNKERHLCSCGTLGGGNHYIELDIVKDNEYALSVHSGSRNLGKKVCDYFQNLAEKTISNEKLALSELHKSAKTPQEHADIQSRIKLIPKIPKDLCYISGQNASDYLDIMEKTQAIAAENRKLMSQKILSYLGINPITEFDTIHNYIGLLPNGKAIIRKGAIDATQGKLVAIPLNMKDGVILGVGKGNPDWNQSAPHGAGRLMSRSAAKESISLNEFENSMKDINSWSVNESTIDEAPQAYKPAQSIIDAVKDTIEITEIVKPVYNFKAN